MILLNMCTANNREGTNHCFPICFNTNRFEIQSRITAEKYRASMLRESSTALMLILSCFQNKQWRVGAFEGCLSQGHCQSIG